MYIQKKYRKSMGAPNTKLSKAHNTVNQQCTSFCMQVQNQTTFPSISINPDCHLE